MTPLKLLSAGAVKRGVAQIAEAYARSSATPVDAAFTQGHRLRARIVDGEHADVVVAPKRMDEFAALGKIVPATRALLGRSRVGVVVHRDALAPDVGDVEAFKRALLAANAVVHNDASSCRDRH